MLAALWLRAKGWALGLSLLIGGLVVTWVMGRQRGKKVGEADAQNARNDAANANARADQLEARHDTDAHVEQLPDAPPQRVGDADPATAAGQLRDHWSRD
ncbi:hypothetical protein LQ772_06735 [Frateuria edaphi]|uniref:hypothetical protein n=1 Tax=Frateuria edaphi TaxID=2898793 RepID=UPI001E409115|nr:hypothetical protein [Frateuria edaphi]UGB46981.1 hypothetical protein LQ772_06735 [Frateuria edaphi]